MNSKKPSTKGVHLVLGGPLPHVMAAKAIAFKEAALPHLATMRIKSSRMPRRWPKLSCRTGVKVLTGGTDNHLLLMDVASTFQLTGRQAETLLDEANLTVNRNAIPRDANGPWYTSGVRMGTPAVDHFGDETASK